MPSTTSPSTPSTFSLRALVALFLAVFVPAFLPATAARAQVPVLWAEASGGNGHWYQRVTTPGEISWSEAQAVAAALGGELVTVESAAEQAWILANLVNPADGCPSGSGGPDRAIWLGLRQDAGAAEPAAGWRWLNGGLAADLYENWFPGRPDNLPAGAGVAGMSVDGTWDDFTNDAGDDCFHSYVIEWSSDCDGNGVVDFGELLEPGVDADGDGIADACERAYGDTDTDGDVDAFDLANLLASWGPCPAEGPCENDLNDDGEVNALDLSTLLAAWGTTPPWMFPTILSVTPASGPPAGGTAITIAGTRLSGTTSVTVGGANATSIVVVNDLTVTAVTPPGTGLGTVALTTAVGTATLPGGFSYAAEPSIASIAPSAGPTTGGTSITISGANLVGTTSVTIGGVAATGVVVASPTSVTAVTPAGTAGAKVVALTTPEGTATRVDGFTYFAAPTIASVAPGSGPTTGSTPITVTGTNFYNGATNATVTIDDVPATIIPVLSTTSISAITPPGTAGPRSVRVTTPSGSTSLPGAFSYFAAPTITAVSPSGGPVAGGTSITITGTNLTGATAVSIGGLPATSFAVVNATTVTAVTPAGTAGAKAVSVTTPDGAASLPAGFAYFLSPSLSSVSPLAGPAAGGTLITITGTNFAAGQTTVTVGGVAATSVVVNAAGTSLTAVTPAGTTGAKSVVVTTPGGSATATGTFTYVAQPSATSVTPSCGPLAGGTSITIAGTNFVAGQTTVMVGSAAATNVVVNAAGTSLTAVTPAGAAGAKNVVMTTPGGAATITNGFSYSAAPTATAVSPNGGPVAGGTTITVTGTNFVSGSTTVTIGGVAATSVNVVGATSLTAVIPPGTSGAKNVVVSSCGGSASLTNGFTYYALPTATSVTPSGGPLIGGTSITIAGTNFVTGQTTVTVGGVAATSVVVTSATSLTANTPAGTAGGRSVVVTTPGGSATATGNFTYVAQPTATSVTPSCGPLTGGTSITVAGTNFVVGQTTVGVGSAAATNVVVNAAGTSLTAVTPAGAAGAKNVVVTTPGGSVTIMNGFSHNAAPTATGVSPNGGPLAGGTSITVTGTNFVSGSTTVTIGGVAATNVVVNAAGTSLTAVTPAGTAGARNVVVTSCGGSATVPNGFTYLPPPTVNAIAPNNGPASGGTVITITGTNFVTGQTTVTIGGTPAMAVAVVSATSLTAMTPVETVGAKDVVVTTPVGSSTVMNGFAFNWYIVLEHAPPPSVVYNAALRNALTSTGLPWRVSTAHVDPVKRIEMVLVPGGMFTMGCSPMTGGACDPDELPTHAVMLSNPYYVSRYEIKQSQWQAFMGSNPSFYQFPTDEVPGAQVPNRPVDSVSWTDVQGFLSTAGFNLRLPTEAEWERACRAGTTTAFHGWLAQPSGTNGDTLVGDIAWWNSNSEGQTRPVGQRAGNAFGLHDMSGNVYEWVSDWYGSYPSSAVTNPTGPSTGTFRTLRGGAFDVDAGLFRSSVRQFASPGESLHSFGFRVVRNAVN